MNRSKGMVIGNISITTTCRQCQDPVCMLCSRAGIARSPDGEVYITESCIGCGICAERCPYGAISIVDVAGEVSNGRGASKQGPTKGSGGKRQSRKQLPMARLGQLAPGPLESPTRDAYDELRKKIAIKCDLCAGYKDQACVQACPTGAAIRIRPTEFFGSTEEILQRNA
jgi:Fe-S-cluster-containing hydrogenase component 2